MVTGWRVSAPKPVVEGTQFTPRRSSRKPRSTEFVWETDTNRRCFTVTRPDVLTTTVSGVTGVLPNVPKPVEEVSSIVYT